MSDSQQLMDEILGGQHDELLDAIIDTAHTRKKAVAHSRARNIEVGDIIRTVNVRPKYLAGVTGAVASKGDKSFHVRLGETDLRKVQARGGARYLDPIDNTLQVPFTCVERA